MTINPERTEKRKRKRRGKQFSRLGELGGSVAGKEVITIERMIAEETHLPSEPVGNETAQRRIGEN